MKQSFPTNTSTVKHYRTTDWNTPIQREKLSTLLHLKAQNNHWRQVVTGPLPETYFFQFMVANTHCFTYSVSGFKWDKYD